MGTGRVLLKIAQCQTTLSLAERHLNVEPFKSSGSETFAIPCEESMNKAKEMIMRELQRWAHNVGRVPSEVVHEARHYALS